MKPRCINFLAWCCLGLLTSFAQPYRTPQPAYGGDSTAAANPLFEFHLALGWINQAAEKLDEKWGDRLGDEGKRGLAQIREDSDFLQERWKSWAADRTRPRTYVGQTKSDLYYRALQGYQRRLKQVNRARDVVEVEQAIVEVAADMEVKAANCRLSKDGLGKDIVVRVRTLRGSDEVGGYEVWCVPRALLGFKDSHVRFPKISSPSVISNLSPGNYLLWVRLNGKNSEQVPQTIGGAGQSEAEVELLVP